MRNKFTFFSSLLLLSMPTLWGQQLLFEEDFNLPPGTTSGTNWSTGGCPSCNNKDWFEVRGGVLEARDVNDWVQWETQPIDISSCGANTIGFSVDAFETDDHEGPGHGTDQDYIDIYYSIDNAPFQVIEDWNGDGEAGHTLTGDSKAGGFDDEDWGSTTVSLSNLSGANNIRLRVRMRNTSGSEYLRIDNVQIGCTTLLGVTFNEFTAQCIGPRTAQLTWQTIQETQSAYTEIQRSTDGITFATIGQVALSGQSATAKKYTFVDEALQHDTRYYYRLKFVDIDGTFNYSTLRTLATTTKLSTFALTLFPNPIRVGQTIFIESEVVPEEVFLYDALGRRIGILTKEKQQQYILPAHLSKGLYFIRITLEGQQQVTRKILIED